MNLTALKAYLIEENGNVNFVKSLARLEADLMEYQYAKKANTALARQGIDMVFDKYRGASIGLHVLTNLALQELRATPDQYAPLTESIDEYMRTNTGVESNFKFGRTSGRGFWRRCDKNLHPQM